MPGSRTPLSSSPRDPRCFGSVDQVPARPKQHVSRPGVVRPRVTAAFAGPGNACSDRACSGCGLASTPRAASGSSPRVTPAAARLLASTCRKLLDGSLANARPAGSMPGFTRPIEIVRGIASRNPVRPAPHCRTRRWTPAYPNCASARCLPYWSGFCRRGRRRVRRTGVDGQGCDRSGVRRVRVHDRRVSHRVGKCGIRSDDGHRIGR